MELFTKEYLNIVFQKDKITDEDKRFLKDKILERSKYADYLNFEDLKSRLIFYQINDKYADYFIHLCKFNLTHIDEEIFKFINRINNCNVQSQYSKPLICKINTIDFLKETLKEDYSPSKKYLFKGECSNTHLRSSLDNVIQKEVNYYLEEPCVSIYDFDCGDKNFIKKVRLVDL